MQRKGLPQYSFETTILNNVPDQPGVYAIFAADKRCIGANIANANLRGALRRESSEHPEALENHWFFVYRAVPDADGRAELLAQWQAGPEGILQES